MGRTVGKNTTTWRAKRLLLALFILGLALPSVAQSAMPAASDRRNRVVLVSIPDRRLAVLDDGKVIATFAIAVGSDASPSPMGEFQIVSRVSNPTYYHSGTMIPSGKNNPLGTRWVGLSQKSRRCGRNSW